MRNILFTPNGWEDYLFWQKNDKKKLRRTNDLIRDISRGPFSGVGKPEPLKWDLEGCWSRRIDPEHRLVYKIVNDNIHILACRYHYGT
ncbi:MAG: Txe/YoeB family addiction module toxin [Alphaproteobacteria bacterium]|jgi:toxin YoeB|nr:Txe/YoeB family addiction module toxin [Alphaproteobacteria bacterium]MBT5390124.1 Txe/YoeB family addiction module toxin [Alphaproteobacteria bacterium]MBT5540887.1 Txe/YoeB family addiction module toxin [Alphaproteobacteria bacterium]MBT5654757.1 Txe/YoeB family addiction module toxin [Alphaproteobacteria bacterium]